MSVDVPPPRSRTRNVDSVRRNSHNHYLRNVSYRQARKALQRAGIDPDTRPEINVLAGRGVVADWRALVGIPSRRPVSKTVDAEGSERARHAPHAEAPRQAAQEPPAFDPWALPSPPDAPQHIGHALRVEFVPAEAITLESTRLLHGAITRALRQPHSRTHPRWSLAPQGRGWAAVFCERELADAVRGQRFPAHMDGLPNSLVFHPQVVRPRAPAPLPAGRYLVTIDTLTPIAWRRMKRTAWRLRTTLKPTPETITNSLHRIVSVLGIDCHVSARAVARRRRAEGRCAMTSISGSEKASAEALESHLRPHVVEAWNRHAGDRRRVAVVAGYFDHAAAFLHAKSPPRPGRVGVGIYSRLDVLTALTRAGEDELARVFRYCEPDVIPVLLCAGSHVAMVYLHPAPAGTVTVGPGGDA